MSNQLACPHCQGVVEIDVALAGRTVQCPHCSGQFKMPPIAQPVQSATQPETSLSQVAMRYRGRRRKPSSDSAGWFLVAIGVLVIVFVGAGVIYWQTTFNKAKVSQEEMQKAFDRAERVMQDDEVTDDELKRVFDESRESLERMKRTATTEEEREIYEQAEQYLDEMERIGRLQYGDEEADHP